MKRRPIVQVRQNSYEAVAVFKSVAEACRVTGCRYSRVVHCANHHNTHHGWFWYWKDDYERQFGGLTS